MTGANREKLSLLERIRKTVIGDAHDNGTAGSLENNGIDLESGTIIIEETDAREVQATGEVLREGYDHETDIFFKGFAGTVFVLDLNPFLDFMGTTSSSRISQSLAVFAENILAQELKGGGSYRKYNNQQFFFRVNKDDAEGWVMAARTVNAIGEYFLRDAYVPDAMIADLLASVDVNDIRGANGEFDGKKALENKIAMQSVEEVLSKADDPQWGKLQYNGVHHIENLGWEAETRGVRHVREMVERQSERRIKVTEASPGMERRKNLGRRDSDNPNKSVW